jgi:phosphoenolpyruvate carboxykinase (ATP)
MSQKPSVYAELLADRMQKHDTRCILLNTGWSGGPYGKGDRMSLKATRALLNAALNGELDNVETELEPTLGLRMPTSCPGVDDAILNPRNTWDDPAEYDLAAAKLKAMFQANYEAKGFAELGIAPAM